MNDTSALEQRQIYDNIQRYQTHFNQVVDQFLPAAEQSPLELHQAMIYAVKSGGKRIRPLLVYATGEMLGATLRCLDKVACCIEFLHTYSLIHDDLPVMDDADVRRGLPACHKKFDEVTAVLAGNALQNLACQLIVEDEVLSTFQRLSILKTIHHAVGSEGVLGGQILDLKLKKCALNVAQIENILCLKTASLMAASVVSGALASGVTDAKILENLRNLAYDFGLAFQIGDDIIDQEENAVNYANLVGFQEACRRMTGLFQSAFEQLLQLGVKDHHPLASVMNYVRLETLALIKS